MKFSIGYNHDPALLELISLYKPHIEALYFPITQKYLGSGRNIIQAGDYANQILLLIKKCRVLDLKSQLLLNATCEGANGLDKHYVSKIVDYVKRLHGEGLDSVIIANPLYIELLKSQVKGIAIESSVNCYVRTLEHAFYLKDLGVDTLTIDRDINRNLPLIGKMKLKTGLKLRLMLNEGCLKDCPFRSIHYNYISHRVLESDNMLDDKFKDRFCMKIYQKDPLKVFRIPFIPPEEVKRYRNSIDSYKLTTRVFTTEQIRLCLRAYIEESFSGNLLDIIDGPGLSYFSFIDYDMLKRNDFFRTMLRCEDHCKKGCSYCFRLFNKAVVISPRYLRGPKRLAERKKAIKIHKRLLGRANVAQEEYPSPRHLIR